MPTEDAEDLQKSHTMGCLTVKTWSIWIATVQITIGAVVFIVCMIGIAQAPSIYEETINGNNKNIMQSLFRSSFLAPASERELIKREADKVLVYSISFYAFLIVLSIGMFVKGIILHVAIKQEHAQLFRIWKVLIILNILGGFIGFITVSLILYPTFKPITVVLICNGMWGFFFIWVVKKFMSELEDPNQRLVLLRRPKK